MAWLSEEPISPMPISATRSNIGAVMTRPMNWASAATTSRLSSLGADGHAQRSRAGRRRATRRRMMPRDFRSSSADGGIRALAPSGKWIRTKLPTLGVTFRPELLDLGRDPGQPRVVVRNGRFDVRAVVQRRHARRNAPAR